MEILNKLQSLGESLGQGKEIVEQVKSEVELALQAKFEEGKKYRNKVYCYSCMYGVCLHINTLCINTAKKRRTRPVI